MGGQDLHGAYGIVAADMQTSLLRRQRHRRNGAARRGRGGGAARRAALAVPLLLFSSFLALGAVLFVAAVSAYAYYSRDLADPSTLFQDLSFEQPSIVYDRTGQVELAKFGELRRELVTFDQIPPEMIDATTAVEDKDFWTNPGFDIGGVVSAAIDTLSGRPRGASTITQQLVRERLLPADAFSGSVYDRKIREIIQSIRLTQAFPGQAGKQKIIEAYLNQNFYGNQTYGVKAAAYGYWGKDLSDLDLAQFALLAAIPQSPTQYDLMRNAVEECTVPINEGDTCPTDSVELVVPSTTDIVQRRNHVLELMETRSVLSGKNHTLAEYQAAMAEPVILTPPQSTQWKAPQFVWQVRHLLGSILCGPDNADTCEAVDTGGYQVTTTLDWSMQQTVDKYVYAAGRTPLAKSAAATRAELTAAGIPKSQQSWVVGLRGEGIHDAAAGVIDYRTGQVLAYDGSAGYYLPGNAAFQPQYDVWMDGFRQPGSSIKPLNYITGLDDGTITAATMFMDVVTEFTKGWAPADADLKERGPVRMRLALEYSLNIPSIKASFINGLSHVFAQYQKFGLVFPAGSQPVASEGIGTLDIHMADLLGAYGAIANGGVLMPRTMILQVKDKDGKVVYPTAADQPVGTRVASPQASYVITNILEGNTIKSSNPYWAINAIYDGSKRRPAGYKTGTTDEAKDIDAFGFVAPPDDPNAPAIAVGVWLGNSNAAVIHDRASIYSSGALWGAIMTDVTKGTPITEFKRPSGLVDVTVDAFSGMLPGPYTTQTVKEMFIKGTEPTQVDNLHVQLNIDQATGLLWQDGCTGPMVTQGFLDFSNAEPSHPEWQQYTQEWAARAAMGPGVAGGPRHTTTSYFFDGYVVPFGRTWGGKFAPTEVCQPVVQPTCEPSGPPGPPNPFATPGACPTPGPTGTPGPTPTGGGGGHNKPTPSPSGAKLSLPPILSPTPAGNTAGDTGPLAPAMPLPLLLPAAIFALARRFRR
jgi:membrane peptidoglycan carboxypeptidase